MSRWIHWVADLGFLAVIAGSVIGVGLALYQLVTAWRQGWVIW